MTVTGTSDFPDRHASLFDGSTTIEFIFTDGNGEKNERAFKAEPYPRTSLKTTLGESKYSDLEPPYFAIAQDDFTGGRGNEDHETDTSRYFDGWRVDTSKESGVVLGGRETYSTGYRSVDQALPGSVTFQAAYSTTRYLAINFTSAVAYTVTQCEIWVKRVGDPGGLQVELWSNSAGEPNAMLETETISAANLTTDTVSLFKQFDWPNLIALDGSSDYWVVIDGGSGTDATNHWAIGCDAATAGLRSSDSSTWTATTYSPYYRITPEKSNFACKFYEYKRQLYMVTQPDSGNSIVYENGDRGVADSNAGDKTNLEDASKSWTTNEWAGCIVQIISGPGSEETQNWRTISSNDSNSLVCSTDWKTTHTTDTEYVILGSNKWTSVLSNSEDYTDVAETGELFYLARGANAGVTYGRYYNNAGTFTRNDFGDPAAADQLLSINHPNIGNTLYGGNNSSFTWGFNKEWGVSVWRGTPPITEEDLTYSLGDLGEVDKPWADKDVDNISHNTYHGYNQITVDGAFGTGIAAVHNLDTPLDITDAKSITMEIMSTVATSLADLKFVYDDVEDLGKSLVASKVFHNDPGTSTTYTDMPATYDGSNPNVYSITWETVDYVYVGCSQKFNKVYFDVTTVNSVASTMSINYFDGAKFVTISVDDDGTKTGGNTTLGQDGYITFTIPEDWETGIVNSVEAYWVRFYVSVNLTNPITIANIYCTRQNNTSINIPALTANQWKSLNLSISPKKYPIPNEASLASFGINVAVDNGQQTVYIRNLKVAVPAYSEQAITRFPPSHRINGMEAYAGNVDDPVENPWIFTERNVYELQTQNSDQLVAVPLKELPSLQSSENGMGHTVNGTYLYFNVGEKIERYFNRTLDDVGPDRDAGLPDDRPGIPKSLASYPGRVFAGIDASSGTSSVLALDGSAWHEVYRAPRAGERIRGIYVQSIPGTNVDRLWINLGSDIIWVPISLNPYNETDYTYTHEATLTTSWIYAGMKDVQKLWKSLKVFAENVDSNYFVEVDYQVDTDTTWTEIGKYDTAPVEEIDIASTLPQAKRIRYRLRIQSNDVSKTPRIKALVTEGVAFVPVKYQYAWNFKVAQDTENIDQWGVFDDTLTSLQQYNQLVSWANTGQPLTFRHHSAVYDNKTVFLNPTSVSPLRIVDEGPEGSQEVHLASITCIEA